MLNFGLFFSVPLGSIRELPAKSCQEINANEGRKLPSGKYWFSLLPGKSVLAHCNMTTEGMLNVSNFLQFEGNFKDCLINTL